MQVSKKITNHLRSFPGYPSLVSERDACGVGFLANLNQTASNQIVLSALNALTCMEHRGGCSADNISGDGSGVTLDIPWELFKSEGYQIPDTKLDNNDDNYCVAMIFLAPNDLNLIKKIFLWVLQEYNLELIGWRNVNTDSSVLGQQAKLNEPLVIQAIIKSINISQNRLDKYLYLSLIHI